jgi:hypothetical protein
MTIQQELLADINVQPYPVPWWWHGLALFGQGRDREGSRLPISQGCILGHSERGSHEEARHKDRDPEV